MIIGTAQAAAELFLPFFEGAEGEKLVVAHLDGARAVLATIETQAEGADSVGLPVRRIIADALRLGGQGIVLAHNHPSGNPAPSREDLEATRELAETAARLGIRVHDHLILGGGEYRSLRALGLL